MYRLLLLLLCCSSSLIAQRNNFVVGFQSGNNFSQTIVNKEFPSSPLNSDFFIGSAFGLVARNKLFKYHWQWGGFSQDFYTYLEYGLNVAYGGYNYRFEQHSIFQEQLTYSIPLMIVVRPAFHKYWYKSFKGKRIFPIIKSGFNFTTTVASHSQKIHTFGEAILIEDILTSRKINGSFVGALGFQKEFKNGRILYMGFSAHTPFGVRTNGSIRVNSPQVNEIATITKQGNFYSIDLQYFIGQRPERKSRKNRKGKFPKIIHNPRYF